MASTTLTAEQRRLRARIGAFALHAQGGTTTRAATAAFLSRFEHEVDPEGLLAPEERARRATLARKAHMSRLALSSSRARSKQKAGPGRSDTREPADRMEATTDGPPRAA